MADSHNVAVGAATPSNDPKSYNIKKAKGLLSKIDLLTSQPVTLMNEGKPHYSSLVGSILSIVFLIIALCVICASMINVGNRPSAIISRTV